MAEREEKEEDQFGKIRRGCYLLARWVRQHCRVSAGWLAEVMGLKTRGGMASSIHLAGCRLRNDRSLASKWKQLEEYDNNW